MTIKENIFTIVCVISFVFAKTIGKFLGFTLRNLGNPNIEAKNKIDVTIGGD